MLELIKKTNCYRAIKDFYTEDGKPKCAERSKVPYINHIDEGLTILERYGKITRVEKKLVNNAMLGFCLHPIVQKDDDLINAARFLYKYDIPSSYVIFAMEYRHIANAYLSNRKIKDVRKIKLSDLPEVFLMLIADKVQNRKDFYRYHSGTHPRTLELQNYFDNWLNRLGISSDLNKKLCEDL